MNAYVELMKNKITFAFSRGGLVLQKNAPDIMIGFGIVGLVGTVVLASKATLKADPLVKEAFSTLDEMKDSWQLLQDTEPEKYDRKDEIEELGLTTIYYGKQIGKLYLPALLLGTTSIVLILGGKKVLEDRNATLLLALTATSEAYKAYRNRVREELGEDVDEYLYSRKPLEEKMKVVNLKGEDVDLSKAELKQLGPTIYARFYDTNSPQWRSGGDKAVLFYLKGVETQANELLRIQGHVFLNEVYDMLGIPRSKEGALVGWVYGGPGDDPIDIGIYSKDNNWNADFVNGYQKDKVLLDFNIDGVIYDIL